MTSPTLPARSPESGAAVRPTTPGRRIAAWLVDLALVAIIVGLVYLSGLIRIQGCDTFDPATGTFGASCPFEQTEEVEREDGSIEVVYVLDSGRELSVDHPTVKTLLLGTRVVDPPGTASYLVGLGYVLAVFVLLQGLTGKTPGKAITGIRLARADGSPPGLGAAALRWLVVDGAIGLFGVLMGLVGGPWPLRLLSVDAAVGLLGGVAALTGAQGNPGDQLARTFVIDDAEAARLRRDARARAEEPPVRPEEQTGDETEQAPEPAPAPAATSTSEPEPEPATSEPAEADERPATSEPAEATERPGAVAASAIPLGPAGSSDRPEGSDEPPSPAAGPTPSSIPGPPAAGARPLWGTGRVGSGAGRAGPGPFGSPEYQATPPLWDQPATTPSDPSSPDERAADEPVAEAEVETAAPPAETETSETAPTESETPEPEPEAEAAPEGSAAADDGSDEDDDRPTPPAEEAEPREGPEPAASAEPEPSDEPTAEPEDAREPASAAAAAAGQQQPFWDEARRAYIFWDRLRQEWLEFDYESQRWGPISRA